MQIHCHIDQEDTELLPGMYLNAVVEAGGTLVPALPDEAIVDYQGKQYIFLLSEEGHEQEPASENMAEHEEGHEQAAGTQHFEMKEIAVGDRELGFTEVVSSDLAELKQQRIVVEGAYALLSKMKNSEEEGGHHH